MTELNEIEAATNMRVHSCSCNDCQGMCRSTPCIGTPEDILRIINAGHIHKLELTKWGAGTIICGMPIILMVTPRQLDNGQCSFFTPDGLCELHEAGLKPTEGKLAHHDGQVLIDPKTVIGVQVAQRWVTGSPKVPSIVFTGMVKYLGGKDEKKTKPFTCSYYGIYGRIYKGRMGKVSRPCVFLQYIFC